MRCEMKRIATPRSRSCSSFASSFAASPPPRASSSPRRGSARGSLSRSRGRSRPPAGSRRSGRRRAARRIDVRRRARSSTCARRAAARRASRSSRGASAAAARGRCSPRPTGVGASVSSWLMPTIPCSSASLGEVEIARRHRQFRCGRCRPGRPRRGSWRGSTYPIRSPPRAHGSHRDRGRARRR